MQEKRKAAKTKKPRRLLFKFLGEAYAKMG